MGEWVVVWVFFCVWVGGWVCSANAGSSTKFIAGVPVLNYHMAYDGEEVLVEGETEGEWIVMVNPGTSDKQIHSMCQGAEHGCKLEGHPSEEQVISRSTACAKEQSMAASWKATPVRNK